MLDIIIASTNKGKIREIKNLYPNINFISLSDLDFKEEIVEDGNSFIENAYIKASYIAKKYHKITMSDDSGLSVRALNYAPGIFSARYAGNMHDDNLNNALLIKNLQGIDDRYAFYSCAICIVLPNGEHYEVIKKCEGQIIDDARGKGGFGYDPYFLLPEYNKTMAEISLEEKNKISHRAKALRALEPILKELELKYGY